MSACLKQIVLHSQVKSDGKLKIAQTNM